MNIFPSYADFVMNKDKFLFTLKFNWEDNAQEILTTWVPEITQTFDQMFKFVLHQSDHHFNNEGLHDELVDSMSIRNILYLYIMRIYGVDQSDEFDYQIVNKIFPISFKVYVKKTACYPQLITKDNYDQACFINILEGTSSLGLKSSTP